MEERQINGLKTETDLHIQNNGYVPARSWAYACLSVQTTTEKVKNI